MDYPHTITRRHTRPVQVGNVTIGGDAPVVVQSMTTTHARDIDATVEQIDRLVRAGCQLVRVAVPTADDTAALPDILRQITCPLVADVHFHYARALEAIEAGVHKIRLNPGNISDRDQVHTVIEACKANNVAVRVGVNAGSIVERRDKARRATEQQHDMLTLMLEKMTDYVAMFESRQFDQLVLSAKLTDATDCIAVNRAIAERFDYPLHLGLTHAGPPATGRIRSIAALAALLADGIGDTIRISYAADPTVETLDAVELLASLNLRTRKGVNLIACPTCGRLEVDLISLVEQAHQKIAHIDAPITVAIMGCVVNGPGEADHADVALCAGKGKGFITRRGEIIRTVAEADMLDALLEEIDTLLAET